MADEKLFHVEQLTARNWPIWSERMKAVFTIKECIVAIEPGSAAVNEKKDKLALSLMKLNINDDSLMSISNCESAREAWAFLESSYVQVQVASKQVLVDQLCTIQIQKDEDMNSFISRAAKIRQQLESAGVKLDISIFVSMVLKGLPANYEAVKLDMIGVSAPNTVEDFRARLIAAERTLYGPLSESDNEAPAVAMLAGPCHYCNKRGHIKKYCRKRLADMKAEKASANHVRHIVL